MARRERSCSRICGAAVALAHARASLIGRPSCPNWPPSGADARYAARCLPRQHPELTHTEAFAQAAHAVRSPRRGVVGTAPRGQAGCVRPQLIRLRLAWCSPRSRCSGRRTRPTRRCTSRCVPAAWAAGSASGEPSNGEPAWLTRSPPLRTSARCTTRLLPAATTTTRRTRRVPGGLVTHVSHRSDALRCRSTRSTRATTSELPAHARTRTSMNVNAARPPKPRVSVQSPTRECTFFSFLLLEPCTRFAGRVSLRAALVCVSCAE